MIAAETPAMTPEPKETDKFSELVHSLFVCPWLCRFHPPRRLERRISPSCTESASRES